MQSAVSGYAGGTASTANYKLVTGGRTGHAEAVEVTFDPAQVSYGALLQIFFSVAHNPTQLNFQGPDIGRQYRPALFPADPAQRETARAYIAQLDAAGLYGKPIVTRVEERGNFYPAERFHQDYLADNPRDPYIVFHDLPKIAALKRRSRDDKRHRGANRGAGSCARRAGQSARPQAQKLYCIEST